MATESRETRSEPITLGDAADFERSVADHGVVLVDFYADWCGPCQMLEPVLEAVAAETAATVLKVDTEVHQQIAARHGVRGIPTTVLYVDGEPRETLVGVHSLDQYVDLIATYE